MDAAGQGNTKLPELDIHLHIQKSGVERSSPGRAHILTMLRYFEHTGPNGVHVCKLFDVLGITVESFRKYGPMPPSSVKRMASQVLQALDYLHTQCGIIHTGTFSL
jgi:serine/threonine-protein kinase SRPK3